jgi:hypothetical protein
MNMYDNMDDSIPAWKFSASNSLYHLIKQKRTQKNEDISKTN